jgi:ribonuclease HI
MIKIHTDGSCHHKLDSRGKSGYGPGAWAYLIQWNKEEEIKLDLPNGGTIYSLKSGKREITKSGSSSWTTNNKMEMMAVIKALEFFDEPQNLMIHTDSMYVFQGITDWIKGWKKNGWKTSKKQPVKNKDLWLELDHLSSLHEIEWVWIKAHNGHRENEIVDRLANQAIKD